MREREKKVVSLEIDNPRSDELRGTVVQSRICQTTRSNKHPKLYEPLCMKRTEQEQEQEQGKTLVA